MHLGALMCVAMVSFPFFVKITLSGVVIIHFVYVLNHYLLRLRKKSVVMLSNDDANNWHLHLSNNDVVRAELLRQSLVSRFLVVLRFKALESLQTYSLVLFADSESPQTFRRLKKRINEIR